MVFPLAWPRGVVPVLKIDHPKIWETEKREERREGRREKKKEAVSLWCIPIHEKVSWNSTLTEELMGEKFKDDGLNAERVYTLFRERIFLWKMLLRRRIFSVSKSRTIVSFFFFFFFARWWERETAGLEIFSFDGFFLYLMMTWKGEKMREGKEKKCEREREREIINTSTFNNVVKSIIIKRI